MTILLNFQYNQTNKPFCLSTTIFTFNISFIINLKEMFFLFYFSRYLTFFLFCFIFLLFCGLFLIFLFRLWVVKYLQIYLYFVSLSHFLLCKLLFFNTKLLFYLILFNKLLLLFAVYFLIPPFLCGIKKLIIFSTISFILIIFINSMLGVFILFA